MTNPHEPYNSQDPQAPREEGNLPDYGGLAPNQQDSVDGVPSYGQYPTQGQNVQAYGGVPQYGQYDSPFAVEDTRKNGVAIAALVFALLALVMLISVALSIFAFIPGLIGVILSFVALSKAKKIAGNGRRKGMSIAALVVSALVTVFSGVIVGLGVVVGLDLWQACQGLNEAQLTECVNDYVNERVNTQQ